jgi:hypothetical protein
MIMGYFVPLPRSHREECLGVRTKYLKSGELLPGGSVRTRRPIPVEFLRQPYGLLHLSIPFCFVLHSCRRHKAGLQVQFRAPPKHATEHVVDTGVVRKAATCNGARRDFPAAKPRVPCAVLQWVRTSATNAFQKWLRPTRHRPSRAQSRDDRRGNNARAISLNPKNGDNAPMLQ